MKVLLSKNPLLCLSLNYFQNGFSNWLQNKMVLQQFEKEKEMVDLCLLLTVPSCEANLE